MSHVSHTKRHHARHKRKTEAMANYAKINLPKDSEKNESKRMLPEPDRDGASLLLLLLLSLLL